MAAMRLERFRAKWGPVRVKKTRQNKNPEPRFDCIETEKALAGSGRRGVAERGDDVIDHFLNQDTVVALAHHANHRLGAGGADQQPAMAVEPFFAGVDRRFDLGIVERLAAAIAYV